MQERGTWHVARISCHYTTTSSTKVLFFSNLSLANISLRQRAMANTLLARALNRNTLPHSHAHRSRDELVSHSIRTATPFYLILHPACFMITMNPTPYITTSPPPASGQRPGWFVKQLAGQGPGRSPTANISRLRDNVPRFLTPSSAPIPKSPWVLPWLQVDVTILNTRSSTPSSRSNGRHLSTFRANLTTGRSGAS